MYNENVVNIKTQVCDDANMTGNLIAFEPALANVKRSNKVNKILKYVIRIKQQAKMSYEVVWHICNSILISERNKLP